MDTSHRENEVDINEEKTLNRITITYLWASSVEGDCRNEKGGRRETS